MYENITTINPHVSSFRVSSWDRSGGNSDAWTLNPGETVTLVDERGPGQINHLYWTTINASRFQFRQLILRAYWDDEETPSVEAPIGDLFCVPHCFPQPVRSLMATVNNGHVEVNTWGFNLYFPMPFANRCRITLTFDCLSDLSDTPFAFWFHADMVHFDDPLPDNVGRFHAQWRREDLTTPRAGTPPNITAWTGLNLDGLENYVALEAEGTGQMVGLHLQIDNVNGGWYGEGDDMVFVDGRPGQQWPPALPGTGSEEIFGGGACPNEAYSGPYSGFHMVERKDWGGKNAMYRWCLADPIYFQRSIVWTIEHGHDNNYASDYTSVAYWYQTEPHRAFPPLPDVAQRLPRLPEDVLALERTRNDLERKQQEMRDLHCDAEWSSRFWDPFNRGCYALLRNDSLTTSTAFAQALEVYRAFIASRV